MSRETILKGEIGILGIDINNECELQNLIEETQSNIEKAKSDLLALAVCTPKDVFTSDDNGDVFFKVQEQFNNTFEWLQDEMNILTKLYVIEINKENLVDKYAEFEE